MERKYAVFGRYVMVEENGSQSIRENLWILIDGNRISGIQKRPDLKEREVVRFDHHLISPGLINGHTHAAMTLFRNFADDIPLQNWLQDHIWPMEAKLTPEQVFIGAQIAAIEGIMGGTTTMNSMYWHPERELAAFVETGARLRAGPPIISGVTNLDMYQNIISKYHGTFNDLTRISLNPHAPYTVTDEDFKKTVRYKNDYNSKNGKPKLTIHTHLAEARDEMDSIRHFAKEQGIELSPDISTPVEYLDSIGVLGSELVAAHSIELTDTDIKLLAEQNVGISANHVSNLKLGNGNVRLEDLHRHQLKVALGTDGPASNNSLDMFETMKFSALTQKGRSGDPAVVDAKTVVNMATLGGAEVLHWSGLGSIKRGNYADLAVLNLRSPHLAPIRGPEALFSTLVYSAKSSDVSDVMINGEWKMRNRKLTQLDLNQVIEEFDGQVEQLFADYH